MEKSSESGAIHILNESLVLAAGSTNGFNKGKNYNRCQRIHELLSLVIRNSSFSVIFSNNTKLWRCLWYNSTRIKYYQVKIVILTTFRENCWTFYLITKNIETKVSGMHGKTAQFWVKSVQMIHLYHDFSRSVRNGDFNTYFSSIPQITILLPWTNQIMLACWSNTMTIY